MLYRSQSALSHFRFTHLYRPVFTGGSLNVAVNLWLRLVSPFPGLIARLTRKRESKYVNRSARRRLDCSLQICVDTIARVDDEQTCVNTNGLWLVGIAGSARPHGGEPHKPIGAAGMVGKLEVLHSWRFDTVPPKRPPHEIWSHDSNTFRNFLHRRAEQWSRRRD